MAGTCTEAGFHAVFKCGNGIVRDKGLDGAGKTAAVDPDRTPPPQKLFPKGKRQRDRLLLRRGQGPGVLQMQGRGDAGGLHQGQKAVKVSRGKRLGFQRSYQGKKVRIYANRSRNEWTIPSGRILLGHNLYNVAPSSITLAPMGFCIVEED